MLRILVPVDFSDTSKNALRYAIALFEGSKLEITVLHVFGAKSTALMMKSIDSYLIKEAKSQMSALINEMEKESPEVYFKSKLAKNYAISRIAEMANSGNYDFIVMGTKGVSGLKEVFMGSVAGGVVSKSDIPVIVVPLDYKFKSLKKLVFAVGDDAISDKSVIQPLHALMDTHDSELEILHISDNDRPDFETMLGSIMELNPKLTHKRGDGDLNAQLNFHINHNDTELLCLLRTKKSFLNRLFSGSVTEKQTFNSTVPLLIIHE